MSATLFQSTYAALRADIIFGKLPPDMRLRLDDLRASYGASVPTLREVLNRLVSERLVVLQDARGFSVAPISAANLIEIAELRKLIELNALEQSIRNGTMEWESNVVAAHYRLSRIEARMMSDATGDRTEWKRYDFEFHQTLIMGCQSAELMALHQTVFDKYLRYQMIYLTFRGQVAADEHRALLDAALARDTAAARATLIRHIDGGVAHALRANRAEGASA